MDQTETARCWLCSGLDEAQAEAARRERVAYRQRIVDAIMTVAARYGAVIDWENSDVEQQIIAFDMDPVDAGGFANDLVALLGGELG